MSNELVPREDAPLGPRRSIVEAFFESKSPKTIRAYRKRLERIADWAGCKTVEEFTASLFASSGNPARDAGRANKLAFSLRAWLNGKKHAPSYVNLHLAALRSLIKFGRVAGEIVWTLDVPGERVETFRDTRGPGWDGLVAILAHAHKRKDAHARTRNVAILMLLATMALRLDEVCGLDMKHVDLPGSRLLVQRKRKKERKWVTMPTDARDALVAWFEQRGSDEGPVFTSEKMARRRRNDGRLAESSLNWLVHKLSREAGHETHPHGLRHAAITEVLEMTNGNVRAAQRFADHANPATTTKYDDNRTDLAGLLANQLASRLSGEAKKARGE